MTDNLKLQELRKSVLEAFSKVDPPDATNITSDLIRDSIRISQGFSGVKWLEASKDLIEESFDCLPLLSSEAYHYYLPAFMIYSLENFYPNNEVLEFLIYSLSPTKTSKTDEWFSDRLIKFTSIQKNVVRSFLMMVLDDQQMYSLYRDAERGLKKFWN